MAKGTCNGGPPVTAWEANPTEGCIAKGASSTPNTGYIAKGAPSKPTRGYIAKEATSNRPKGTSLRKRRPGAGLAHVDPVPS